MEKEEYSVIPSEELRNEESEYYQRLKAAREKMVGEEALKTHKMVFGMMDSVGGVREDVFEFFLGHNFEHTAQVMRSKDLFSRLADVQWFQFMFEEKSMKDKHKFPYWQEAIVRAFLEEVPLEQFTKMYELAFAPIDVNRMISVYKDRIHEEEERLKERLLKKEEKGAKEEENSDGSEEKPEKSNLDEDEFFLRFTQEKEKMMEEFKREKERILADVKQLIQERAPQQEESGEMTLRQGVAKSAIQNAEAQDEETTLRQDVASSGSENPVMECEDFSFVSQELFQEGVQISNFKNARKQQEQRMKIFDAAYRKMKKNRFLKLSFEEQKSELFNILVKRKLTKDYMITVNNLMRCGMNLGVVYDFIERDTSIEELKDVLEAFQGEEAQKETFSQEEPIGEEKREIGADEEYNSTYSYEDEVESDYI